MVEGEEKLFDTMSALAILTCRPNSHPFQERHLSLHEPIKIGRSVARARPAANNCIFDCKVLSRHHAILWYENGSFYLQDTKSSNGTFVNNQRLCKGGEESPPREIFSNDLIQFGVEVMENNRRGEKITHGCIIATIALYHPDGREAKPDPYLNAASIPGITIQSQDLYQLAHYLQEALHREKMLEQKLSTLQELVHNTQEASESGWQALIDEDKLLSRLEVLENQLHTYSKNHSEDALRQELVALQDEKLSYETTAKESLRRVLQEKLEAVTKLSDLERSLSNAENECMHLKHSCEQAQQELQELAEKYQEQLKEVAELTDRLAQAESTHEDAMREQEKEKGDLNDKIQQMVQQEAMLSAKIEAYQADNDFAREQIAAMKAKYESMKELNENEKIDELGPDMPEAEIIPLTDKDGVPENLEAKLKETQQQIEQYKAQLEESEMKLKETNEKVEELQKELDQAKLDSKESLSKISSLEDKIKQSDMHINQMMENALDDMKLQLNESQKQCDGSNSLISQLRARVVELEEELVSGNRLEDVMVQSVVPVASAPHNGVSNHVPPSPTPSSPSYSDSQDLKDLLEQAQAAQKKAEVELAKSRDDLKETKAKVKKSNEEVLTIRSQLQESQQLIKDRSDVIADLQDQLKKAEGVTKDVKQQILDLRDRLLEEQEHTKINTEEVESLRQQLEDERTKHKQTQAELSDTRRHLQESQQNAKQSHNEAEQLKNKLKHLQEELDSERREKRDSHTPSPSRHSHGSELHLGRMSSARNKEFQALKEECANLRKRIQAIEAEMKMSRRENLQLSSEYNKLQESYKQLEALKVSQSSEEVEGLQTQLQHYSQRLEHVRCQLTDALKDYRTLANRCKTVSMCSSIPLLLLLFAFLLALYPTLARLTATTSV